MNASETPIVISVGCPRTGTTFVQQMLAAGRGYASRQVSLLNPLHPTRSRDGLIGLLSMVDERCLIVRTRRHPMRIVESFHAIRPDVNPASINDASDQQIVDWIECESRQSAQQREVAVNAGWAQRWIEVAYEDFDYYVPTREFVDRVTDRLPDPYVNALRLRAYHDRVWRRMSVRDGCMAKEIILRDALIPDDRRAWFEEQLAPVIEREGYA